MSGRPDPGPWRRLHRHRVYENPWIAVDEDLVELPTGHTTIYRIDRCSGCVGMLPFVDASHVLLVQQWRYIAQRTTWGCRTVACTTTRHSTTLLSASSPKKRARAAGVHAGMLTALTSYATSKSVVDETAHLSLAHDLTPATRPPDDTELLRLQTFDFTEALAMVLSGEIIDSMTIIAMLWADRLGAGRGR